MGAAQRAEIRVARREVGVFLIIIGGKLWLGELWETRDASVTAQLVFENFSFFFLFPQKRRWMGKRQNDE